MDYLRDKSEMPTNMILHFNISVSELYGRFTQRLHVDCIPSLFRQSREFPELRIVDFFRLKTASHRGRAARH